MSDLQNAFPPVEVRDNAPAVCCAIAILGIVLGGFVVAARINPVETRVAINMAAPVLPTP